MQKASPGEALRGGSPTLKFYAVYLEGTKSPVPSTGAGTVPCLECLNPGKVLGRWDVTAPEVCFFLCLAPDTWIYLAVPGDRKGPELAGASFPDNLSALTERQRVSGEWCTESALISPAFVCVWFLSRSEVVTVTTSSMNHVSVKKQSFNCLT